MRRTSGERDLPTRQIRAMRESFPQFTHASQGGGLVWRGTLRPTTESPVYSIVISHPFGHTPEVWVVKPSIHRRAPHRYGDGSLCLFWPREWRWSAGACMAETLVPWTAFWLYFYEIWLVTDDWLGPSSSHGPGLPKEAA